MSGGKYYYTPGGRQDRNEKSKVRARRHMEPWSSEEDAFIRTEWIGVLPSARDEAAIAECLERSIEACRNRAEVLRGVRSKSGGKIDHSNESRQTIRPLITVDDDDPLKEWYA